MKLDLTEKCACGASIDIRIDGFGIREVDLTPLDQWRQRHATHAVLGQLRRTPAVTR